MAVAFVLHFEDFGGERGVYEGGVDDVWWVCGLGCVSHAEVEGLVACGVGEAVHADFGAARNVVDCMFVRLGREKRDNDVDG